MKKASEDIYESKILFYIPATELHHKTHRVDYPVVTRLNLANDACRFGEKDKHVYVVFTILGIIV